MNILLSRYKLLSPEAKKSSRNFIWNTVGICANTVNSLFFLIIVTRLSSNGMTDAGIFSLSFNFAVIMQAVSMYGIRAFQVTDVDDDYSSGEYCATRLVTCMAAVLITLFYVVINRYDVFKCSVLMLLALAKVLEGFSDVYYGIMQKHDRLDIAGIANTFKSVIDFAAFLLILLFTHSLLLACASLVIINLAVLVFYEKKWAFRIDKPHFKFSFNKIRMLLISCFALFVVSVITLTLLYIPRTAIDKLCSASAQGIYGFISMPATAISLFATFLIQFFLSFFAKMYSTKNRKGFAKITVLLLALIFAATVLFEIFCYFFGVWLLKLLYGQDLTAYLAPLMWIIVGASFLSGAAVFCSGLTTMRITRAQLWIYVIDTIIAIFISQPLVRLSGISGAAFTYVIIAAFQFAATGITLLFSLTRKKFYN